MRILAGVPNHLHNEIAQLEVDGFKKMGIEVITSSYGNSGQVTGAFMRLKKIINNAVQIRQKALEHNSDIIYLNTAFDKNTIIRDAITVFIIKFFGSDKKVVLKLHGSEENIVFENGKLTGQLKKFLLNKTNLLLVLSKEEENNFRKIGISNNKIEVTANPLEQSNYSRDERFKSSLGLTENCKVLLFAGRFIKEKGILDLIEACKLLNQKNFNFYAICLGDGPVKKEVEELIKQYQLQDKVKLTGYVSESETKYYYSNCDILVLPTYHQEGFPMAVFQAVAAGKAVITTRIRAAADYFTEFENCLWVTRENPGELSANIYKLASNKELLEKISLNNLELAKTFSKENITKDLKARFEEMIKK